MTTHLAAHRPLRSLLALVLVVGVLALPAAAAAADVSPPGGGPWRWPLDGAPQVIRGFEPPPEPWLAGHRGVDLRGSPGDAVRAAGPGRVSFAGAVAGKPVVVVAHEGGLRTTYEPVVAVAAVGDEVPSGSVLGRLSSAGSHCLPQACLHWGLRRADTYLDPLALVGGDLRVRLLPVWGRGAESVPGARGRLPPGRAAPIRLRALNPAWGSPFSEQ